MLLCLETAGTSPACHESFHGSMIDVCVCVKCLSLLRMKVSVACGQLEGPRRLFLWIWAPGTARLFGCRRQGTVGPYKVRLVSAATWSHTSLLVLGCVGSTSIYVSGILLFLSH